jgi:hypothetical protein
MRVLLCLLALTLPAVASIDPEGYANPNPYGSGHTAFHNFYSQLYNAKKQVTCCHERDCRPTVSRHIGDHIEIKINGVWMRVAPDAILPKTAPDWGAHVCAGDPSTEDPQGRVYCVILPPET